jgi:cell wall-associated NlpC family hydrolase
MTTRADVVAAARSLLNTPYHTHSRLPGVGVDCVGVPLLAARIAGIKPADFDIQGYSMTPDGSLLPLCDEHLDRIPREQLAFGDVVVARFGDTPHHIGIVGDWRHGGLSMIHAENYRHHKVIEHRLWFGGAMKFVAAYRIPGVEA